MSRILVTGMSGTGKSAALAELARRGYRVVDTDDPGWSEWVASSEGGRRERLWVEDRMTGLLEADDDRTLFVQGCVRNQATFYDRFDAVVLLSAPAEVILDRVARRTTNDFGKTPAERAMILDDLAQVEPLLRASCTHEVDASRPLAEVVADLVAIASSPITTPRGTVTAGPPFARPPIVEGDHRAARPEAAPSYEPPSERLPP
jgi:NAD(P)-dependent dehydrogenase (short-subunit alcohol dehydrogenase family)